MTDAQLASLICSCATPIIIYNDELRALAAADNMGALSQKMAQGDQIMQSATLCITNELDKSIESLNTENTKKLIKDQCHLDARMVADLIEKAITFEIPTY